MAKGYYYPRKTVVEAITSSQAAAERIRSDLATKPYHYRPKVLRAGPKFLVVSRMPTGERRTRNPRQFPKGTLTVGRRYIHEHLADRPKGATVRTITTDGHQVRVAYWGPKRRGRHAHYKLVSILHPIAEAWPCAIRESVEGLMRNPAEFLGWPVRKRTGDWQPARGRIVATQRTYGESHSGNIYHIPKGEVGTLVAALSYAPGAPIDAYTADFRTTKGIMQTLLVKARYFRYRSR